MEEGERNGLEGKREQRVYLCTWTAFQTCLNSYMYVYTDVGDVLLTRPHGLVVHIANQH